MQEEEEEAQEEVEARSGRLGSGSSIYACRNVGKASVLHPKHRHQQSTCIINLRPPGVYICLLCPSAVTILLSAAPGLSAAGPSDQFTIHPCDFLIS